MAVYHPKEMWKFLDELEVTKKGQNVRKVTITIVPDDAIVITIERIMSANQGITFEKAFLKYKLEGND